MGSGRAGADPLAELARLVGQNDPYQNVFRSAPARQAPFATNPAWPSEPDAAPDVHPPHPHDDADYDDAEGHHDGHYGDARHGHGDAVEGAEHGWDEQSDPAYAADPHDSEERYYAPDDAAHRDDAGIADEGTATDAAAAAIPDLWVRGDDRGVGTAYGADPFSTDAAGHGTARRPLIALAAVLVLTGGGLAASFMAKGNGASGTAATGRAAPTIMAATGPTKVKQDDPAATAPEDQDAALLNRTPGAVSGPVKVIPSEEQPVDLGQLPRTDPADATGAVPQPSSPFPEPKKVKTFVVHPDGAMLSEDGVPVAPAAPPLPPAVAATPASPPLSPAVAAPPADPAPAPLPATPKTAARGATTPKSATIASLAVGDGAAGDPQPAAPAKPSKPPAAAASSGFGLQLAASPSEADAHAAFAKLKKKYPSELGSLSPSVHKSETGGKPVYRVRVGGMSRADATDLCSKLMAGGGSCFVVHD